MQWRARVAHREVQRASDAERERVAGVLRRRWSEGYLSLDTFEVRVGRAYGARSLVELRALLSDLPRLGGRAVGLRDTAARWLDAAFPRRMEVLPPPPLTPGIDRFLLGRGPICDVVLDDRTVSRHHAQLRRDRDLWVLTDLASTNGTYINGWHIREAVIHGGDEVCFGDARFVFGANRK